MKILIVEDEISLNKSIYDYLTAQNYACDVAHNHFDAEDYLLISEYDLLVVDINLPDGSGLDLIRMIKKEGLDIGMLVISARDSLDDKLAGLDLGADDYLTKPFHLAELNSRVNAIIRRRKTDVNQILEHKELKLNPALKEAKFNSTNFELTPKQYDILEFFVVNKNKVITKESLANYLWQDGALELHNLDFIYNHVKNIRSNIKMAGGIDYIKTIYGVGYKLVG